MKYYYLSILLLLLNAYSSACSCSLNYSFCNTYNGLDIAVSGKVTAYTPHGLSLQVLHVFHGTENRDTITIWDRGGPYNMCNDSSGYASASSLARIGDTIIIALAKIDSIENAWDITGDYRTPGFNCNNYILEVQNSTVIGLISGSEYCYYMQNCLNRYDYTALVTEFATKSQNCAMWLSANLPEEDELFNYYPNPSKNAVSFFSSQEGDLRLINQLGQQVASISLTSSQFTYSTANLPAGNYFLQYKSKAISITRRLIVSH